MIRGLVARLEIGPVSALLVAAAGLFAFLRIAGEVREGETHAFDEAILRALRSPLDSADPIGPWWLESMMRDLTALGGTTVLTIMTLVVVAYLALAGKRGAAWLVVVSIGGGALLSSLLKLGFDRPRPDLVAHLVDVRSLSFPSGHAMLSAVTYLTLGVLVARVSPRRRIKVYVVAVAVLLTLAIGASRVYLGVHWPTDVLAGWSIGATWAMACWLAAVFLQRRGSVEDGAEIEGDGPAAQASGSSSGSA
ncbi:phosphatase PAP2 family protein [Alsobacter sp. R-9]